MTWAPVLGFTNLDRVFRSHPVKGTANNITNKDFCQKKSTSLKLVSSNSYEREKERKI